VSTRAPDTLPNALSWATRAACAGATLDDFFEERATAYALALCARCPVRSECLAEAMAAEGGANAAGRHGIFGGLGPTERAELRRQARQAAPAEPTPLVRTSPNGPPPTSPCGTRAAYRRHLRRDEEPCALCRAAESRARKARGERETGRVA
jgi:hypothetical protein